jgi:hypothetical protein
LRSGYWWYEGRNTGNPNVGAEDNVSSSIPFAGFFAEMAYPGWRSTWQFLASRFVSKEISGWVKQPNDYGEYHCAAQGGVLLEGRIQSEANITSNLFFGLYGRYSYQNVSGVFNVQTRLPQGHSMDVNVAENTLTLQLHSWDQVYGKEPTSE